MKIFLVVGLVFLLSGCGMFSTVGEAECSAGAVNYCALQIAAEQKINEQLDRAGSATCVDLVHSCGFRQCGFTGCQVRAEAGDWVIVQLPDDVYMRP